MHLSILNVYIIFVSETMRLVFILVCDYCLFIYLLSSFFN